jgi:activator of HSP90 ATPase
MALEFEVSTIIGAPAQEIYAAWLDSGGHAAMTGGAAHCSAEVGGSFDAWDGYIQGVNLILEPGKRIVQTWRTVEFSESDPDSQIEVIFEPVVEGTQVTLRHSNLPAHGDQYKQGWVDSYFELMKKYFER